MSKFGWCYIGCGSIANTTAKEISQSEKQSYRRSLESQRSKSGSLYQKNTVV